VKARSSLTPIRGVSTLGVLVVFRLRHRGRLAHQESRRECTTGPHTCLVGFSRWRVLLLDQELAARDDVELMVAAIAGRLGLGPSDRREGGLVSGHYLLATGVTKAEIDSIFTAEVIGLTSEVITSLVPAFGLPKPSSTL